MASSPQTAAFPVPTDDEKSAATLAHALQLVGGWIAPLIVFVIKRQSKFASFHALQALLLQVAVMVVWFGSAFVWVLLIIALAISGSLHQGAPPPPMFFVFMPFAFLMYGGLWVCVLVLAIVHAVRASRGEWAAYPVVGDWARRILHI